MKWYRKIPKDAWATLLMALVLVVAITVIVVASNRQAALAEHARDDSQKTVADLIARSNRLQDRIDQINATNAVSTCRTDLSAAAQSEMLRGNADVLNGLAKVADNSLDPSDVAALVARAKQQIAEADRRDRTLALCPPPVTP